MDIYACIINIYYKFLKYSWQVKTVKNALNGAFVLDDTDRHMT